MLTQLDKDKFQVLVWALLLLICSYPLAVSASQCDLHTDNRVPQLVIDSLSPISLEDATSRANQKATKACASKGGATILNIGIADPLRYKGDQTIYRVYACICCKQDSQCPSVEKTKAHHTSEENIAQTQYQFGLSHYASGNDDIEAAQAWFLKAAQNGNSRAQEELGMMFLNGEGDMKNIISAYVWLSIAQMHGEHIGGFFPNELISQMTEDELMHAQDNLSICLSGRLENCQ